MNTYYRVGWYGDVSGMLRGDVMERARRCLERANAEKASLRTPDQVRERQGRIRAAFFAAIGGLPPRLGAMDAVWGPLRTRGSYSVQNVLFRAAPEVVVTATVWRPAGWSGRRPGILFPCGHHEFPREVAEYQEVCAGFAANGYVTLAFDPPGQGEQKLCWDPVLQASFAGSGSAEHEHYGVKWELLGGNIARCFLQHGLAAFDLLAGLPEVDPARIAVTGNSGGGTQSSYLMMAEERLAAGMPCTFTTDRGIYMRRPHWHDEEQNLTGALLAGLDYDDFYFCFAPRPAAIGAVTWDFFPIEGTREAYARVRHAYSVLSAEERIALFEVESGHCYHPILRRHAVEYFNRFLQQDAEFRELAGFEPEPPEAQRNTPTGQVSTSLPAAKLVHEQLLDAAAESHAGREVPPPEELRRRLGLPARPDALNPRVLVEHDEDGVGIRKGFLMSEPAIAVPFLRLSGVNAKRTLLYCHDAGIAGMDAPRERLLRHLAAQGTEALLAEPRGIGETDTRPAGSDPAAVDMLGGRWIPQHYRMLGTSLGALRAHDIACVAALVEQPLILAATGMVAWSAILAAALNGDVEALLLEGLRPSIEEFATERTARVPQAYAIPGILRMGDLADLVRATGVGRVLIVDPLDALGRAVTAAVWEERYAGAWAAAAPEVRVVCGGDSLARNAEVSSFLQLD